MKNRDPRLAQLTGLAELIAERHLSALAKASAKCTAIRARIAELDRASETAKSAQESFSVARTSQRFLVQQGIRRAALLQELALHEAERQRVREIAQKAEGQRQALARLRDQAS